MNTIHIIGKFINVFILLPIAMVCLVVAPFITKLKNALKNDKIAQGFSLASIILFVWPLVIQFDEHDLEKIHFQRMLPL